MERHVRSLLSRSPRSKLLAAGASLAAIALFVLILPTTAASGQTSGSTSTLPNAGVLRLRLGAEDSFKWHQPNSTGGYQASPSATQSIGVSNGCRLALSGDPLASFSALPNSAFPGFVADAIGVRGSGEGNGQPCGRIDPGQTLTMNLAPGVLDGKVIDFAEIDLELKFGGAVTVTGYFVEGNTATQVGSPESYSSAGSDSGPDSGDGDNYRVRFPRTGTTAVNRLVFSVGSSGSGSLEGGADLTGACDALDGCVEPSLGQSLGNTTDSLFHLTEVDGVLDCGDVAEDTDPNDGIGLTIQRLNNAGGGCGPLIAFSQSGSTDTQICNPDETDFLQCIFLGKDLLGQDAQFFWTVTWAPEDGSYMETPTEFDFGPPAGLHPLALCAGDTDGDGFPNLSGTDPWCVVSTSTDLIVGGPNNGLVVVTETYFGSGDPLGKRG